jgi:hypothetical protein
MSVLFEEQGGILEPEKMVAAHVQVAQHHGAHVHTGKAVQHMHATMVCYLSLSSTITWQRAYKLHLVFAQLNHSMAKYLPQQVTCIPAQHSLTERDTACKTLAPLQPHASPTASAFVAKLNPPCADEGCTARRDTAGGPWGR